MIHKFCLQQKDTLIDENRSWPDVRRGSQWLSGDCRSHCANKLRGKQQDQSSRTEAAGHERDRQANLSHNVLSCREACFAPNVHRMLDEQREFSRKEEEVYSRTQREKENMPIRMHSSDALLGCTLR